MAKVRVIKTSASATPLEGLGHVGGAHLRQLSVLQRAASEPASAGDEQVEHRPAKLRPLVSPGEPAV